MAMRFMKRQQIAIQSMGNLPDSRDREIFHAKLASSPQASSSEKFHDMQIISVDTLCGLIHSHKISNFESDYIRSNHVILADPEASMGGHLFVDILVGQNYYHTLVRGNNLYLTGGLVLVSTVGGYALAGPISTPNKIDHSSSISMCVVNHVSSFRALSRADEVQNMKMFSSLENLGIGPLEEEISPVLDRFNHTTTHNGERYSVFLPKRSKCLKKLPSNCSHTFRRLRNTYNKLNKPGRERDLEAYNAIIREQLDTNVLERVSCIGTVDEVSCLLEEDFEVFDHLNISTKDIPVHYLPHFSVRKSSTGKLRLVYDAAAKSSATSYSLNDCLETGPDLINSLMSILIRFRLHRYAFKSDIQKAFLQIEIDESDRDLLRSMWIEDNKVWVYRFARLPFGLTCAPFILAATLKKHLSDSNISPEDQQRILESFYVDDNVSGADRYL